MRKPLSNSLAIGLLLIAVMVLYMPFSRRPALKKSANCLIANFVRIAPTCARRFLVWQLLLGVGRASWPSKQENSQISRQACCYRAQTISAIIKRIRRAYVNHSGILPHAVVY